MRTALLFFALLLVCLPVYSQDTLNVEVAGSLYGVDLGQVWDIDVQWPYVYTADGVLSIIDVSDPTMATFVASSHLDGFSARTVCVEGDYAYVCSTGLRIVDISNPADPVTVGTCLENSYDLEDVVVQGDYMYVVEKENTYQRMYVFDISDRTAPTLVDFINRPGTERVAVAGDIAVLNRDNDGFTVLDISDPTNISEIASLNPFSSIQDIWIDGSTMYLAVGSDGIRIWDISDPAIPQEVGFYETPSRSFFELWIEDHLVYATMGSDGNMIFDVSDPANPTPTATYDGQGEETCMAVQQGQIYIGTQDDGVRVVDASDPYQPVEAGYFEPVAGMEALVIDGDYLYMMANNEYLLSIDISDPFSPTEAGRCSIATEFWPVNLAVFDNHAYLSTRGDGMYIIDVTNPVSPVVVDQLFPGEIVLYIEVDDGNLYAIRDNSIFIYELSDPSNPSLVTSIAPQPDGLEQIEVQDGTAYVVFDDGDDHRVQFYDVSDLNDIHYLGQYAHNSLSIYDIVISDHLLYVLLHDARFEVVDVVDPANPVVRSTVNQAGYSSLDVYGDYAFFGYYGARGHGSGFLVFDFRDPERKQVPGYCVPSSSPREIAAIDDQFVCVVNGGTLNIYDCSDATRSWIDITLTADEPVVVPQGGTFTYGATLSSNLPSTQLVDIWTDAYLPSGSLHLPVWVIPGVEFSPATVIENPAVVQTIPMNAPLGEYTFRMKAGSYPSYGVGKDTFRFEVVPAVGTNDGTAWSSWGFDVPGTAGDDQLASSALPAEYRLEAVWPNPFNAMTTVRVTLPEAAELRVVVYNVTGQQVAELVNGLINAGSHEYSFDATHLASGLYFVRATVPGRLDQTQKLMLIR
ncbi:T9SS type A sorting domain-containing protein [bacterium]|nr:T9SS type A sorting domain-containing protein [bacterium]